MFFKTMKMHKQKYPKNILKTIIVWKKTIQKTTEQMECIKSFQKQISFKHKTILIIFYILHPPINFTCKSYYTVAVSEYSPYLVS